MVKNVKDFCASEAFSYKAKAQTFQHQDKDNASLHDSPTSCPLLNRKPLITIFIFLRCSKTMESQARQLRTRVVIQRPAEGAEWFALLGPPSDYASKLTKHARMQLMASTICFQSIAMIFLANKAHGQKQ